MARDYYIAQIDRTQFRAIGTEIQMSVGSYSDFDDCDIIRTTWKKIAEVPHWRSGRNILMKLEDRTGKVDSVGYIKRACARRAGLDAPEPAHAPKAHAVNRSLYDCSDAEIADSEERARQFRKTLRSQPAVTAAEFERGFDELISRFA